MKKLLRLFLDAFEAALKRQNKQAYNSYQVLKTRLIMCRSIFRKQDGLCLIDIRPEGKSYRINLYECQIFDDYEVMQLNTVVFDILRRKLMTREAEETKRGAEDLLKQANKILEVQS